MLYSTIGRTRVVYNLLIINNHDIRVFTFKRLENKAQNTICLFNYYVCMDVEFQFRINLYTKVSKIIQ